ncbi:fructose-bisphosphate aldolase/2-amino-3,7-dideoxy-D-threo-hept-6-ulosonate synthase [Ruminiclostridium sufflavum DSM 19573]|uniref:Fructose-bisphosphate aldolase/2-amino-3,7-dideoxy-D-threo-hept-6-ulosonate synthase n=1 Tax=Ruminiclostridium sufflavum DSM 19573 TaxID=1121337 RepID=A0A318XRF8_9FIRM|nr:2-amino-3,7-dideoxy-D-threo-hept-6-ulosonate synthase [Ruminiclostridium sufflavum]PYG90239.1 fructose-bisphosphate aldolase/2-amino-3,7-dideoxy-D-threo-hept-6-ulosonate synthase [Ruminiclostridium sufflavum DSM 19573]
MKDLRLRRLICQKSRRMLITPLDHGVTLGPIDGISNIRDTLHALSGTKVNSVVLHKGNIINCSDVLSESKDLSVILHLSASIGFSPNNERKVLVACVEEGARLGVDGVSIHVNLGSDYDYQMINDFGHVADECQKWGLPLLAMMYPRGKGVDEKDVNNNMIAARVAMEIGADIVKVNYMEDKKSFEKIVRGVSIPVVIAGGEFSSDSEKFLRDIKDAIDVGAAGVAIGRNVFQRKDMEDYIAAIDSIVNKDEGINDALKFIQRRKIV